RDRSLQPAGGRRPGLPGDDDADAPGPADREEEMSAVHPPRAEAAVDYSRKWFVMTAVVAGILMATIDSSIVNIAFPTLVESLGTTFNVIQWVSLAYLLTNATFTLGVGRLGDVLGKKRLYVTGFAVFTIAS